MQENGIGSHDAAALGEEHAVPIDPLAVDRIEVVRGPATLRDEEDPTKGYALLNADLAYTLKLDGGLGTERI